MTPFVSGTASFPFNNSKTKIIYMIALNGETLIVPIEICKRDIDVNKPNKKNNLFSILL